MPEPTDAELADYGLRRSDYEADLEVVHFTEGMAKSWDLFLAMSTQWRQGAGGPTGLDYNVLPVLMNFYKIESDEQVINDLRVLEGETLRLFHKK